MSHCLCIKCHKILTNEEKKYYGIKCAKCEKEWTQRIQRWRDGADDPELDAAFGVLKIMEGN